MIRALALWLITINLTIAAEPGEAPDIKGLRLGMAEVDLIAAMPSLRCRASQNPALGERVCSDPKNTLAGNPASVLALLRGNKAFRITFFVKDRDVAEVRRALISKFGEPQHRDSRNPVTIGGNEVTRIDDNWLFPPQALQLVHLRGARTDSWVSLTDLTAVKEIYELRQKDI